MDNSLLDRLFSGQKDFLAEVRERILVIDEAIQGLTNERAQLEAFVKLYEPPGIANAIKPSPPVTNPKKSPSVDSGQPPKVRKKYTFKSRVADHPKISLENKILNAFKNGNLTVAHHSQVAKFLGKETPKDKNATIRRMLTSMKQRGLLATITVQRVHAQHGSLFNTAMYGLPEIFGDVSGEVIKPEFEEAKNKALNELGFSEQETDSDL